MDNLARIVWGVRHPPLRSPPWCEFGRLQCSCTRGPGTDRAWPHAVTFAFVPFGFAERTWRQQLLRRPFVLQETLGAYRLRATLGAVHQLVVEQANWTLFEPRAALVYARQPWSELLLLHILKHEFFVPFAFRVETSRLGAVCRTSGTKSVAHAAAASRCPERSSSTVAAVLPNVQMTAYWDTRSQII